MAVEREVIHLAPAAYYGGDGQVVKLARRFKRRTNSPKVKRAMGVVLKYEGIAAELAIEVYEGIVLESLLHAARQ